MSLKKCIICLEETGKILSRCSCGDASIICDGCFYDYWGEKHCPYYEDVLPHFKCPICKNIDKKQQLSYIFEYTHEYQDYSLFLKGKMKIIKFLVNKLENH